MEQQIDSLAPGGIAHPISDRVLTDLYTMLGCVRELIAATANAQGFINQINWRQWATLKAGKG